MLLCISVSGRNCGTTSKTHILTLKRLIVPLLRLFVPLIRAEKKIRRPDWMAFFAPFGEYWQSVESRYALGHAFK